MDWADVRIFLAIARAGSLGAAARAIGQTQPTMGRRLRALEQALGQTLFQRTQDGFILTDEGHAALAHAELMEAEALAFERAVAGREGGLEGLIKIAASDWFGVHVLTPQLSDFAAFHPRIRIELLTDARLVNLARREADLAFRIASFEEPDVLQRKVFQLDYALYASHHYRFATDPAEERLVMLDQGLAHLPDARWLQRQFPGAESVFASNNRDAQARACASGLGVAVLPRILGDSVPGVRRVETDLAPPNRAVWMGYHRDLRRLPRLRALIEFLNIAFVKLGERGGR